MAQHGVSAESFDRAPRQVASPLLQKLRGATNRGRGSSGFETRRANEKPAAKGLAVETIQFSSNAASHGTNGHPQVALQRQRQTAVWNSLQCTGCKQALRLVRAVCRQSRRLGCV